MQNTHQITLGADPELFIKNNTEIVSAEGLTKGGTKSSPKQISQQGHAIQEDGIMFEYNIPPATSIDQWVSDHNFCIDHLRALANKNGYELSDKASDVIDSKYLQTDQATTFGCEPDFNVYLRSTNPAPDSNTNLRCAGGHVAVGYNDPQFETSEKIVKMFDILVVLPALFKDNDTRRRELYGKAGSFRIKEFGVECRALSNFWIQSEELMRWVYTETTVAVSEVLNGDTNDLIGKFADRAREAIDTNSKDNAKIIMNEVAELMTALQLN